MSVLGLAILGKKNEPLYLCDTVRLVNSKVDSSVQNHRIDNHHSNNNNNTTNDNLSKTTTTTVDSVTHCSSLSLNHQLIMYAALDCFDEVVDTQNGLMPVLRNNSTTNNNNNNTLQQQQQNPHWLGLLYRVADMDGPAVYGYVTATNIKFFILVTTAAVVTPPPNKMRQQQHEQHHEDEHKTRVEPNYKGMVADIHQAYISYVMNPFNQMDGTLHSNQFDTKIQKILLEYML